MLRMDDIITITEKEERKREDIVPALSCGPRDLGMNTHSKKPIDVVRGSKVKHFPNKDGAKYAKILS